MTTLEPAEDAQLEILLEYLRQDRGFDFTGYKRGSLRRRIVKRMSTAHVDSFADYRDYLEVHPDEFIQLFNTVLINVTRFFRDADAWTYLRETAIPRLLAARGADEPVRVWSAGCSSGEEAYTLAILFAEALGPEEFRRRVKIYATDVDDEALAVARQAMYSAKEIEGVAQEWRERYFEEINGRYLFRTDMRRAVIFGHHDITQDAPISRLDLLVCRNTLMYLNAETQRRVLTRFHFALNPDGFLFLGKAELLLTYANLFTPEQLRSRVFTKAISAGARDRRALPPDLDDDVSRVAERILRLRAAVFEAGPLPEVVLDPNGIISDINAKAKTDLGLSAADVGRPFRDLEISYRPVELRSHMERVLADKVPVQLSDLESVTPSGIRRFSTFHLVPVADVSGAPAGVSLVVEDVTRYHEMERELERSSQELETSNEELQSSNEELETTNEELQSTNEELETTNEELQSSNEELETMNEELQSTNEELETLNTELQERTDQYQDTSAYLSSILDSMHGAIAVVNQSFEIESWNQQAEELWGLRSNEAIGQSLFQLDIGLALGEFRDMLQSVMSGNSPLQEVQVAAINRRGRSIQCRVAITPLHAGAGPIRGTILLMEETHDERESSQS